jgi:hypothetical protein
MKDQKLLYIFKDPLGADESKVGITGNAPIRWGVYQNSYSRKSHTACFDVVYVGSGRAIANLEKAVKQELHLDIEMDGRGHSEWISMKYHDVEKMIDEIIEGYRFKVIKVPKKYLPMTVDNYENFLQNFIYGQTNHK